MAVDEATTDKAGLAVSLEFVAALLRSPDALRRYGADLERRLEELAAHFDNARRLIESRRLSLPVTIWGLFDRHRGADVAIGATLGWEATTMRYALLMHYREPGEGEISEEAIAEAREAFGAYGRALESAGVLLSADVLQPSAATTTVTRREGGLQVQDGPFAETKEALAGIFVLEAPDLDAAIGWAEKCPGAQWGVIEVRPTATAFVNGAWTR